MTYQASSAPQSIGGVLDDWLRLFSASFSRCWLLAVISVAAGAITVFAVTPTLPPLNASAWQHEMVMWSLMNGPQNALASLALVLIIMVVTGALFATQIRTMQGGSLDAGAALNVGLHRVLRLIAGVMLQVLIMFAIAIPMIIVGIVVAVLFHSDRATLTHPLPWVLIAVLGIASACVFIYVSVRLLLWQAAVFVEDAKASAALGRSWRLVKGHWWRVTGILFVANIVIGILGYVVPWALSAAFGLFSLHAAAQPQLGIHLRVAQMLSQTTHLLTLPLSSAISLVIFRDLTLRVEGADLAARAEALGAP